MTARRRVADRSPDQRPYGHLVPVLEAELSWGNSCRDGFRHVPRDDTWTAHLAAPLHLDRLLAEFEFPDHIRVGRTAAGDTYVFDDRALVGVSAASGDRSRPLGPPRPARTGLLARIVGP